MRHTPTTCPPSLVRPVTLRVFLTVMLVLGGCSRTQAQNDAPAEAADQAPPVVYTSMAPVAGEKIIAFDFTGTQILVDNVFVNGRGPFRFMFDSGAQGAGRLDASLIEQLGLKQTGEVEASDSSGRAGPTLPVFQIKTLRFGDLEYHGLEFISRNYNSTQAVERRGEIDGILGVGLFKALMLTIDFPNTEFRISEGALPAGDDENILALSRQSPVPAIEAQLNGEMFTAFIDTGSMIPFLAPGKIADRMEFSDEPRVVGKARSVAGEIDIKMATVKGALTFGGHRIGNPTLFFADSFDHIILGSAFFKDFVLEFDFPNHRIRMTKTEIPGDESNEE